MDASCQSGTEAKWRRRHSLFPPPTRSHFTHEPRPFRIIPLSVSIKRGTGTHTNRYHNIFSLHDGSTYWTSVRSSLLIYPTSNAHFPDYWLPTAVGQPSKNNDYVINSWIKLINDQQISSKVCVPVTCPFYRKLTSLAAWAQCMYKYKVLGGARPTISHLTHSLGSSSPPVPFGSRLRSWSCTLQTLERARRTTTMEQSNSWVVVIIMRKTHVKLNCVWATTKDRRMRRANDRNDEEINFAPCRSQWRQAFLPLLPVSFM